MSRRRPLHRPLSASATRIRRVRLLALRFRRLRRRLSTRLMLFGGWTWVAAGSLLGFEMLDVVLGSFLLAPELLPLVVVALAIVWLFRERLIRVRRHLAATARGRFRQEEGRNAAESDHSAPSDGG